jgi:hypothetical protein
MPRLAARECRKVQKPSRIPLRVALLPLGGVRPFRARVNTPRLSAAGGQWLDNLAQDEHDNADGEERTRPSTSSGKCPMCPLRARSAISSDAHLLWAPLPGQSGAR